MVNDLKNEIESKRSSAEISQFVKSLPFFHLELIASDLNLSSGMPRVLLANSIINYYIVKLSIRNRRIRRYELDIEENDTRSYTPPHSPFQRCIEIITNASSSVLRIFSRRSRTQYVRLERIHNNRR